MQLCYAPGTNSVAVAIALNEASIPYDPILVDFTNAEQRTPEYHKINLADPHLCVLSTLLEADGVDTAKFPKSTALRELMAARPSVRSVIAQGML